MRPGLLVTCEVTGKRVLPSECGRCSVSNKVALKRVLLSSSISSALVSPNIAIRSSTGRVCLPAECKSCAWTGQNHHPDDIGTCTLTGLSVCREFLTTQNSRLRPLFELLNDVSSAARDERYPILETVLSAALDGQSGRIVSGAMSPTTNALAVCAEVRTLLGLKVTYIGFVFSPQRREIIGKVVRGKRTKQGWFEI